MKKIALLASGAGSLAKSVMGANLALEIVRVISDRPAPVIDIGNDFGIPTSIINYSDFASRS